MRRFLRQHIPSMFHRRLVLLGLCAVVVLGLLGAQTAALSLGASHRQFQTEAESALRVRELIPTIRGRILDRKGRVLAKDAAGWEIAVNYPLIAGEWAYHQASAVARDKAGPKWTEMSPEQRESAIQAAKPPFDKQVRAFWEMIANLANVKLVVIERRKNLIRKQVQEDASYLWSVWQQRKEKELNEPVPLAQVSKPIREQKEPHTIVRNIDEATRVKVQQFIAEAQRDDPPSKAMEIWRQAKLRRPKVRIYPFDTMTVMVPTDHMPSILREKFKSQPQEVTVSGVAEHILGTMREVWAQDVDGPQGRPFHRTGKSGVRFTDLGGYRPGDTVGASGIENTMEGSLARPGLRGIRGVVIHHLDSHTQERREPKPGRDIHLTIDIALQARIQAIMSHQIGLTVVEPWHSLDASKGIGLGKPLNGAAVVIDADTSQVLAAVSMPAMPRDEMRDDPEMLYGNVMDKPWINRAVSRPYQPGSTIKPIMLASAVSAGVYDLSVPIVCNGMLDPKHPKQMRCWIYKEYGLTHGPLLGSEAIAKSCNVFFYTLGEKMGIDRIKTWYGNFGLGTPTNCGLGIAGKGGEEVGGAVGNPEHSFPSDPIFMGMGQGPVSWTPMQAVGAYADLVRGGKATTPTLIRDDDRLTPRKWHDLHLNPAAVKAAIEGVRQVVNATYGTGRYLALLHHELIFNVEGITMYGKSGTADPGKWRWIDTNQNGKEDKTDQFIKNPNDHAWFMGLVQPDGSDRIRYIIAVVTEFGGSGGQVSGPIVNQIVYALKQEGYF